MLYRGEGKSSRSLGLGSHWVCEGERYIVQEISLDSPYTAVTVSLGRSAGVEVERGERDQLP